MEGSRGIGGEADSLFGEYITIPTNLDLRYEMIVRLIDDPNPDNTRFGRTCDTARNPAK